MKLRFTTYNICHCADFTTRKEGSTLPPDVINVQQTAEILRHLNADIVGLNEIFEWGNQPDFERQAQRIAQLANYPYYGFAKGFDYDWCTIGNAILSKYTILRFETIPVPTIPEEERVEEGWYEDRVLAVADIDVGGAVIKVISTHFGLMPVEQERIVKKVCEIIDSSSLPCVIMGDFNATPNDAALSPLFERVKSCAAESGDDAPTFASFSPKTHIDYICIPKRAKTLAYKVHTIVASDHFPLSAEVEIE